MQFIIGLIIGLCISILYKVVNNGISFTREKFKSNDVTHRVIDTYYPFNPKQSQRQITIEGFRGFSSRKFFFDQSIWGIFDQLRSELFNKNSYVPYSILILGGGGGSLAIGLHALYPKAHITLVDNAEQMRHIAHKYFLKNHNHWATYVVSDATAFITKTSRRYDLVFVDIFDGPTPQKSLYSNLKKLRSRVSRVGFIIWNLGFDPSHNIHVSYKALRSVWKTGALLKVGNNFMFLSRLSVIPASSHIFRCA